MVEVSVLMTVGRDLIRPNMSAGGTCMSSLIAAPTFPRTVPRTSTLQRHSRTSVADQSPMDCSSPGTGYHHRAHTSYGTAAESLRSQPAPVVATSRQTQHGIKDNDRSVITVLPVTLSYLQALSPLNAASIVHVYTCRSANKGQIPLRYPGRRSRFQQVRAGLDSVMEFGFKQAAVVSSPRQKRASAQE